MPDPKSMEALLKWSLSQSDGTRPSKPVSEEDRKWFAEAMQAHTFDIVKRMKEITIVMNMTEQQLLEQNVTEEDLAGLLEELQEHVESIDMANDLNAIGGLIPLLNFTRSSYASVRARACEVISTVVQNNPKGQANVLSAKGMENLLYALSSDTDVTVRAKALGAISSLIRHNRQALDAFRLGNGFSLLKEALSSKDLRFQRKALIVLHYMLQESPTDRKGAVEANYGKILIEIISSNDQDARQSALSVLLELTVHIKNASNAPKSTDNFDFVSLKDALTQRMKSIKDLSGDDLECVIEERYLIDKLWVQCFDEPSIMQSDSNHEQIRQALDRQLPADLGINENVSLDSKKPKQLLLGPSS